MNDLTPTSANLPTTIEDLAKFVLIGQEKLKSVRAEIRAIEKLGLAQEVREQKRTECQMLGEALLDANVRIGELTQKMPKSTGGRPSTKTHDTDVGSFSEQMRTKEQAITNLGLNPKQVERFETLANNPKVVEFVKKEARENDDIPTQSRVLQLVRQKKEIDIEYVGQCKKRLDQMTDITTRIARLRVDDALIGAITYYAEQGGITHQMRIATLTTSIEKLIELRTAIMNAGRRTPNEEI